MIKEEEFKWGRVFQIEGTACAKAGKTGRAWRAGSGGERDRWVGVRLYKPW